MTIQSSFWFGGTVILSLSLTPPALAQSIAPAPDGTGTVVQHNGNTYTIHGGTQAGTNLFHSFQMLGLSSGEIADFLSNPSITNILGRVTGGEPSVIDGLIQVTGANSNLYLMNPAGIVFGSGASLNIGGDFYATTSDRIDFAGGGFSATGSNDYAALTGAPNQFAFLSEQPGAIVNFGDLTTAQDVNLIGGTILNQGNITSSQGNVVLAAVPGERLVKLSEPGMLLSLEVTSDVLTEGIAPLSLPELLAATSEPISAKVISAPLGDVMVDGAIAAAQIDLYAAGQVTASDGSEIQGETRVVRFSETGENPNQAVFIDARADSPEALLYGAEAGTVSQIIERDENGIEKVTTQLTAISGSVGALDSVAIVAEGNEGNFWLGNQWIRAENIADYAAQLQTWGESLTTNADILLYSCFTALGATGEALVNSIASLTGADVAASVDATGSANYEANWQLETHIGSIEASNPFTTETLANWDGKLATRTVTNNADSGALTLRDALDDSGGGFTMSVATGDSITFNLTGSTTINLSSRIDWSAENLTLDGSNEGGGNVVVNGNKTGSQRVFRIDANNATIQNLTIQNGAPEGSGGGISHIGSGTLSLSNSTVTGNSSGVDGGGIFSNGTVHLVDSTVANNTAGDDGGGIFGNAVTLIRSTVSGNVSNATSEGGGGGIFGNAVTLISSTVSGNSATYEGGGIFSNGVTLTNATIANNTASGGGGLYISGTHNNTIANTIIANNTAGAGTDIQADLSSSSVQNSLIETTDGVRGTLALTNGVNGNIIGQDPLLGPLQNNGGSTQTHALQAGSPAIDAGDNTLFTATPAIDQTGNPRTVNGTVDIGAYERQETTTTATTSPTVLTCDVLNNCTPDEKKTGVPTDETTNTPADGQSTLDTAAEEIEADQTSDFSDLSDTADMPPLTLQESQGILKRIATETGIQPSLLYFQYAPSTVAQTSAPNPLIASTALEQLDGLYLSQNTPANSQDQLQVVLVTPDGSPIIKRPLGATRGQITPVVRRFKRRLNQQSAGYLEAAQQLYDWLIRPLEADLAAQDIQNISIIADDGLRSLPVAALHDGEGFVIERYSVGLMPSLSLIDSRYRPIDDPNVLAMGASEFTQLNPLPAVPTELALITRGQSQPPLLNEAFTIANLQRQSRDRSFDVLHLATHATFQAGAPDQAYVQLWGDDVLRLESFRELGLYQDPALELLILSACQTALGDADAELGFAGASLQAGVKSVLASLWQVSDLGTMRLMSEFYSQWADPAVTIKAEALRQAQLSLLRGDATIQDGFLGDLPLSPELARYADTDLTHPFYWSAFTLVGSPW